MLFLLAAIWGASYLFIKVALDDLEPAPMMAIRSLAAGADPARIPRRHARGRRALAELREAGGRARARRAQRRDPVLAHRVGRDSTSTRPSRGSPSRRCRSSRSCSRSASCRTSTSGRAASRESRSDSSASLVLAGLDPRGGWLAAAGTLAVVLSSLSYAIVRRLRAAARADGLRARARDRLDAGRRPVPRSRSPSSSSRTTPRTRRRSPRSRR